MAIPPGQSQATLTDAVQKLDSDVFALQEDIKEMLKPKPLSDEEIMKLWCLPELNTENEEQVFAVRFARAIEERILGK